MENLPVARCAADGRAALNLSPRGRRRRSKIPPGGKRPRKGPPAAAKRQESQKQADGDDRCRRRSDDDRALDMPWEHIAAYLPLHDVLRLRLTSSLVSARLREGLGARTCSRWLESDLHRRHVYLFNDASEWMSAKQRHDAESESSRAEALDGDGDDNDCLMGWLGAQEDKSAYFDRLLMCLRVVKYMPRQLTVGYSGKFGRHCWGITHHSNPSVTIYAPCRRGNRECSTCRTAIQRAPIDDSLVRRDEALRRNGFSIDDSLQIPVAPGDGIPEPRERLRLDVYHTKCIPNLPPDLLCPCCRISTRRTLLLTEMSYRTEPSTERRSAAAMALTFTPSDCYANVRFSAVNSAHLSHAKKPRRIHGTETGGLPPVGDESAPSFPPQYREGFIYNMFVDDPSDVKRGIAIHCDACELFGLLAPARLVPMPVGIGLLTGPGSSYPALKGVMLSSALLQRY